MALNIKVLGPGCVNCERVLQVVVDTLEELEVEWGNDSPEVTVQHVTDRGEFLKYGLMFTPGLVINERLVCGGRIPSEAEVKDWMTSALAQSELEG
ncbi:MAG: thioredoxin family protein [Chloroflexi bacterium]|nr:thioredoxin family protein [Chloroflexota bacterium]